jgi:hypothetical protein
MIKKARAAKSAMLLTAVVCLGLCLGYVFVGTTREVAAAGFSAAVLILVASLIRV